MWEKLGRHLGAYVTVFVVVCASSEAWASPSLKDQERAALRRALSDIIQNSPLANARVSAQLRSLDDGTVVFAQNADELLNPASNVKLVTAAAALGRLGLDYRFETEFLTSEWVKDGRANTLYVRGKGDPSFTTEKLYGVVSELAHAGLTEVTGDLIVDDTFFDGDRVPPGYDQETSDRSYMAPPGALSLNSNTVGVYLRPGKSLGRPGIVEVEPPSDFFVIDSQLTTGTRLDRKFEVSSRPEKDGRQRIVVTGTVPSDRGSWSVWKKIDEPALYFGHTLKKLLELRGIGVKGRVKVGLTPPSARIYFVAQSESLDVVLKRLNKNSSNFVAENLVKTLGAEAFGSPGTTANGVEAIENFLEQEVGLVRGSYVMKNGSGLNDTNRFSSGQMVRILYHMYERFPLTPEYLSALTIAGKDGTLKYRFEGTDAVGRLRAKTGTLENVSSLSGYVQAVGGERFMFSVLVNDFPGRAGTVVKHIDSLGAQVAAFGVSLSPQRPETTLATRPQVVSPADDSKTRAAVYARMGAMADKRNLGLFRTAFRTEKDALVKVILADAMFQADPRDYAGLRWVLDSLTPSGDVFFRARAWAHENSVEMPGIAALLEWSSAGDFDALARVLELAKVSLTDEKAADEVAQGLSEIARRSADELIVALRNAPSAEGEAGLRLLVQGLHAANDAHHPFWPALKRARASVNAELASFAQKTELSLVKALAERHVTVEVRPGG